eukprot:PhM_4_TR7762/c0_g1_i1/m.83431
MNNLLLVAVLSESVQQVRQHLAVSARGALSTRCDTEWGGDEAEAKEGAAFLVGRRRRALGQVRLEHVHPLLDMPFVDDTNAGGRRELGPVRGFAQPLKIVAEKSINRRAAVHDAVGDHKGVVRDRVRGLGLDGLLHRVEDVHVGLILGVAELEVQIRGDRPRQHQQQFADIVLVVWGSLKLARRSGDELLRPELEYLECDLDGSEALLIGAVVVGEAHHHLRELLGLVQEEEAMHQCKVVNALKVAAIHVGNHAQHVAAEVNVANVQKRNVHTVGEEIGLAGAAEVVTQNALHEVKATRREGQTEHLQRGRCAARGVPRGVQLREEPLEVGGNLGLALAQRNVTVNALADDGAGEHVRLVQVKNGDGVERELDAVVVSAEVVEDLGHDERGELAGLLW